MSADRHLLVVCIAVAILLTTTSVSSVEDLVGARELESSENYDEPRNDLEFGYMTRQALTPAKPNVKITQNGNEWTIRTISWYTNEQNRKFKINDEFEEDKVNGSKQKTAFTIDGDKHFVQTPIDNNNMSYSTLLQVVDGKLKVIVSTRHVVCTQINTKSEEASQ